MLDSSSSVKVGQRFWSDIPSQTRRGTNQIPLQQQLKQHAESFSTNPTLFLSPGKFSHSVKCYSWALTQRSVFGFSVSHASAIISRLSFGKYLGFQLYQET